MRNFRKANHQVRKDFVRRSDPVQEILPRVANEQSAKDRYGEHGREEAKEKPADQEFPDAVGITRQTQDKR